MGRQVLMVFFGKPRSEPAEHATENPPVMTIPLIGLAVLTVFGGALNIPGIHTLTDWLEHTIAHVHATDFNVQVAILSVLFALIAIGLSWLLYGRKTMKEGQPDPLRRILGPIFVGMENAWWIDELYNFLFIRPYIAISWFLAETVDWRFWHDWFHDIVLARTYRKVTQWLAWVFDLKVIDAFANGLGTVTKGASQRLRVVETGYVRNYALAILVGGLLVLSYFIFG